MAQALRAHELWSLSGLFTGADPGKLAVATPGYLLVLATLISFALLNGPLTASVHHRAVHA